MPLDAEFDLPSTGLHIPGWAMVAIPVVIALLGLGAAGGIRAYALDTRVRADSALLHQHLTWASQRSEALSALGFTVTRVDAKVDALTRLKCLESRDIPDLFERQRALDRLLISQIDCSALLAVKVPGQ